MFYVSFIIHSIYIKALYLLTLLDKTKNAINEAELLVSKYSFH